MQRANRKIEVLVNGRAAATTAQTLSELIVEQDLSAVKVATAVNGDFVPAVRHATTQLSEGDKVEIVTPRQGG